MLINVKDFETWALENQVNPALIKETTLLLGRYAEFKSEEATVVEIEPIAELSTVSDNSGEN